MGPLEEAGKAASGFMSAMTSQPVMLGMVVIVLSLIGLEFITLKAAGDARKNEFEMIFAQQKQVQDILSRCIVPESRGL